MQVGVVFPQTEFCTDPGAVREYAQTVEALGYTHVLAYDHVLGANTASRPDWRGTYNLDSTFHDPLVLFSHMAGATRKIGFFTGILILSQRQTALVARQTADLDIFCEGRLRLGIGTGWNEVEYEALAMSYADRFKMYEEQVGVLRRLWTERAVTIHTERHSITDAGIWPLPVQRPIPIWMGGGSDRANWGTTANDNAIRRIARLADGWIPLWEPGDRARELLEKYRGFCREYGRDPAKMGLEGRLNVPRANEANWAQGLADWRDIGATHLSINTMGDGLRGVEQHLKRLEEVRRAITF
jgi:probable F420-dependent oxidoreductase